MARPYTLFKKRSTESADTLGKSLSCFLILPAILSGERPSNNFSSTKSLNAGCIAIFLPWNFARLLRTYALWCAFLGSYLPLVRFRLRSSETVETERCNARAMSQSEYPFFSEEIFRGVRPKKGASMRVVFFMNHSTKFSLKCSDSSADSGRYYKQV